MEATAILEVFVDGSFDPASRRGGWGLLAMRGDIDLAEHFGGSDNTDSGAMEVEAILKAIEWLREHAPEDKAVIWSDSVYAVTGCNRWRHIWKNNGWKKRAANGAGRRRAVANADTWKSIDTLLDHNETISIEWCKGHDGLRGNDRAHELAERGRLTKA